MKVWVIGQGILGKAFKRGLKLRGIDHIVSSHDSIDIRDHKAMLTWVLKHRPTHLVNCSGFKDVNRAEKNPALAHAMNAQAVESMGCLGLKVMHFSTNHVFDGRSLKPYEESDLAHPLSVYGMTKLRGEHRLLALDSSACVIRTSWLYGLGGDDFVSRMIEKIKVQKSVRVVVDQMGTPSFADDVAEAAIGLLDKSGIWHVVNQGLASRLEWTEAIRKQTGGICEELVPARSREFATCAERPKYSVLSTKKLSNAGIELRSWQDALADYFQQKFAIESALV